MLSPCRFSFLSREAEVKEAADWNTTELPRLWIYNLHYFDDLLSEGSDQRAAWHIELMDRWIEENPLGRGAGWEPYPLSRRVVNWIMAALSGLNMSKAARGCLAQQARWLRRTLEFHLRGNHLLVNAKALVFLGCYFSGSESDVWLGQGLALLETELREQILSDGGHFELSPMYHALILEDLLDLIQLASIYSPLLDPHLANWIGVAGKMLHWLAAMTHPDGEIGLFNDATLSEARTFAELACYARGLGVAIAPATESLLWLRDTGYVGLRAAPWTVLFDAAAVGPRYIPGHAHADTLSLEMSLGSERIVTNAGTSTYDVGEIRDSERATSSHSTVAINGENSSEVWASFRVGRRARVTSASATAQPLSAVASHDGYRFLPGSPSHTRRVDVEAGTVTITDTLVGAMEYVASGRYHLHPSIVIEDFDDRGWRLRTALGMKVSVLVEGASCGVEEGYYAPEFGIRQRRPVLLWRFAGVRRASIVTRFRTK